MNDQTLLRRRIATLEWQQELRREMVAEREAQMKKAIEKADLEIANLKAQLTIGVVR